MKVRRLVMSPEAVLRFLENGALTKTLMGVPHGARFAGGGFDLRSNDYVMFVWHESFDDVPNAKIPGELRVMLKDVRRQYEFIDRKAVPV